MLDELYGVDLMSMRLRQNKFAGSAFKFGSSSWPATLACYALLAGLGYLAWSGGLPPRLRWPERFERPAWVHAPRAARAP